MATTAKDLKRKRAAFKAKLTQFKKYLDSISTGSKIEIIELNVRLEKIEEMYSEYDALQLCIETSNEFSETEEYHEREEFEQHYFRAVASARGLLNRNSSAEKAASDSPEASSALTAGGISLKLPTITLPAFSGSSQDWLEFHDTYLSLIHTNDGIPTINKFHYLRASLKDSAKQVIGSLDFSASNYEVAWQTLCDRYHNDSLLIGNHIQALLDIESIPRESSAALRGMIDTINKNLRALRTLNVKTENWDVFIIHLASGRLDSASCRAWKQHINLMKELPTLCRFISFLKCQAELLESVESTSSKRRHSEPIAKPKSFVTNTLKCNYCKQAHPIYQCMKFKTLSLSAKLQQIKQMQLCVNCLRQGHDSAQCRFGPCKICNKRHNTMLHSEDSIPSVTHSEHNMLVSHENGDTHDSVGSLNNPGTAEIAQDDQDTESTTEEDQQDPDITLSSTSSHSCVLLSTAIIHVLDCKGNKRPARALLDNGSTTNFVTEKLIKRLELPVNTTSTLVEGINCKTSHINKRSRVNLFSVTESFSQEVDCLIVPQITQFLPTTRIDISPFKIPPGIKLADPEFNIPSEIDILLSSEMFWTVLGTSRFSLGKNMPVLSETKFGWLISGAVPTPKDNNKKNTVHCNFLNDYKLQNQLDRFFELESVPCLRKTTNEEEDCENYFKESTLRQPDGRFVVKIPLKGSPELLGDSYHNAARRFHSLEKRFQRDSLFKEKYFNFINEYINLGHMSLNSTYNDKYTYIMPHHGILKESSLTTKLRSVFDASSPTSTGVSFNEIQHVGPCIQDDLFSILIRFRQHKYVVTSDCEKMYRCVLIAEDQRGLQQILFRFDPTRELELYRLNTVSYGTASAMWLATRCLAQLAYECTDDFSTPPSSTKPYLPAAFPSVIRETILHDFYVDDLITGHNNESDLLNICQGVISQLKKGQFHLRKWRSNSSFLLEHIPNDRQDDLFKFINDDNAKTLGLRWSCEDDRLLFSVNLNESGNPSKVISKRSILSTISQVFDPLGLINPCLLQAKLLMQGLWASNLSWDDNLPAKTENNWLSFLKTIPTLNEITIPRHALCVSPKRVEMHSFSDASLQAYCSCIYLRSFADDGSVFVHLIAAKSKVAPLKEMTVPRLELGAALLSVRLAMSIKRALRLKLDSSFFWCDSTVVLGWIRAPKSSLKAFVLNRINEITEHTDSTQWKYVPTNLNPADIGSRGCDASQLKKSPLWWHGPPFLLQAEDHWPNATNNPNLKLPELKLHCNFATLNTIFLVNKYSNYSKLQRVLAFALRFIHNSRNSNNRYTGYLKIIELNKSDHTLCKLVQMNCFPKEYHSLSLGKPLPCKSRLGNLNPFFSEEGVMRVGGRLCNSNYDYDTKHPILLHSSHHVTLLLFRYYHRMLMHAGPQLLLSTSRHKYWTMGGRNIARKVTHECVTCCRFSGKSNQPMMSSLPKTRVQAEYPFSNVSVDYAGPIMLADRRGRGCKLMKSYICVFVCMAVRAVHVELVTELSTEAFIAALNRFIARRGKPFSILSDNGTNFVGAYNEFSKFLKSKCNDISAYAAEQQIQFRFSPAYSPHFNGLAEGSVKSIKHHLKRTLSLTHLTYEEMNTLLVQIEGILNSRPLTPLSSDPNDLIPLTPSHFLIGRTLTMMPSRVPEAQLCNLARYKRIQVLVAHFWSRYYKEYISEMQKRVKWQKSSGKPLQVGDMIVVKDDRLPPNRWQLGRIIRLQQGSADRCPRVADILTSSGVITRAYNRICVLPTSEPEQPGAVNAVTMTVQRIVPPRGAC